MGTQLFLDMSGCIHFKFLLFTRRIISILRTRQMDADHKHALEQEPGYIFL